MLQTAGIKPLGNVLWRLLSGQFLPASVHFTALANTKLILQLAYTFRLDKLRPDQQERLFQ